MKVSSKFQRYLNIKGLLIENVALNYHLTIGSNTVALSPYFLGGDRLTMGYLDNLDNGYLNKYKKS
jgi:hypothetical protein